MIQTDFLSTVRTSDPARLKYKHYKLQRKLEVVEVMLANNERESNHLHSRWAEIRTQMVVLEEALREQQ